MDTPHVAITRTKNKTLEHAYCLAVTIYWTGLLDFNITYFIYQQLNTSTFTIKPIAHVT